LLILPEAMYYNYGCHCNFVENSMVQVMGDAVDKMDSQCLYLEDNYKCIYAKHSAESFSCMPKEDEYNAGAAPGHLNTAVLLSITVRVSSFSDIEKDMLLGTVDSFLTQMHQACQQFNNPCLADSCSVEMMFSFYVSVIHGTFLINNILGTPISGTENEIDDTFVGDVFDKDATCGSKGGGGGGSGSPKKWLCCGEVPYYLRYDPDKLEDETHCLDSKGDSFEMTPNLPEW